MKKFIISIDAGTTSNRSILFDLKGKPVFSSQKEFTQYFPKAVGLSTIQMKFGKLPLKL